MFSDSDSEGEQPLFCERPEWSDVTPIPQYDTDAPIAPILYTPEYKDVTDYFRAIVQAGERSERVLQLTEELIRQNPAHYTAWQYRYETLLALDSDLTTELALIDNLTPTYLKTYQIWHHRRLLQTLLRKPQSELSFLSKILQIDTKNYHTWSYRQWLLSHFLSDEDLWKSELDFIENMIGDDIRNNSAWHHRFFVVFGCGVRIGEEDRARVIKRELIFVKQQISLAPNNPSAWNYLRGVLQHTKLPYVLLERFVKPYTVTRSLEEENNTRPADFIDLENPGPAMDAELPCVQALEFMADIYEREAAKILQSEEGGSKKGKEDENTLKGIAKDNILQAIEIWKNLASTHDTMRKKYWDHRIREALVTLPSASTSN